MSTVDTIGERLLKYGYRKIGENEINNEKVLTKENETLENRIVKRKRNWMGHVMTGKDRLH